MPLTRDPPDLSRSRVPGNSLVARIVIVGVRNFSLVNCRGSGFGYLVVLGA